VISTVNNGEQAFFGSNQRGQSKPIIAKDNFLLAHKNLIPGVSHLVKQKEK